MKENYRVDIHADDYGYSLNTSKDILECMKAGKLDSISIICNMKDFAESMNIFYEAIPSLPFLPLISVHLCFPEGKGVTDLLPISWGKLFLSSYPFCNSEIKDKLKKEMKWQIDTVWEAVRKCIDIAEKNNVPYKQKGIRIDSHIHTHPIPVVWKALLEVIDEEKYDIEYIRNPKEPLMPFLKNVSLIGSYGIINIIKNRILNLYSGKIDRYLESHKIDRMYMWGLAMSGHMDYDRIEKLYPDMLRTAQKNDRVLELLFHPGRASKDEYSSEMSADYFRDSNSSENRHVEKNAVMNIKSITDRSID